MSLPKSSHVDAVFTANESHGLLQVADDQTARSQSCPSSPRSKEYDTAHSKSSTHHLQRLVPESSQLIQSNLRSVLVKVTPNDEGSSDVLTSASRAVVPARDHQFRHYQIKSIRKGLPRIATDKADGRGSRKKRSELQIVPHWICQPGRENKADTLSWVFSIFVAFVCVIFPLVSFSSDVAFYITCTDHYNHTAEILEKVRAGGAEQGDIAPRDYKRGEKSISSRNPTIQNKEKRNLATDNGVASAQKYRDGVLKGTAENQNESSCADVDVVLNFMRTDEAPNELEAHRHVTVDIFEPVFILGSFPSLVLCILTRLVILVTGHSNILSAFVMNLACMPLQLITGALSVHSASYHLGKTGFECWHCAEDGDCSGMQPLWWLYDGLTKVLLISVLTKILDGVAGGIVLCVVISRKFRKHAIRTFWHNVFRYVFFFLSVIVCCTVSPIMVITPAMMVMRLGFMELATPFPGRDGIQLALTVLMTQGVIMWSLSFASLAIFIAYNMYVYFRQMGRD